jgi:NAD(P)-dependent dehydrogenase (short-subunit alcohol dehydrogenase family)
VNCLIIKKKMMSAKTFIVTGANAGIGKEIARGIGKQGYRV